MTSQVIVHPNPDTLAAATAARLALAIIDAQSVRDAVHVVLTGGTMGTRVAQEFGASPLREAIDPTALHLWWGDERYEPTGSDVRNDTAALAALADWGIPSGNIHSAAGPDTSANAEESAARYAVELNDWAGEGALVPQFDVVMLGVGPDGHVASLFPGREDLLGASGIAIPVHDSPKPPPDRVSLTFEALNSAQESWLIVAGAEKAPAVSEALAGAYLPCAQVHGSRRTLWLLDVAAAGEAAKPAQ